MSDDPSNSYAKLPEGAASDPGGRIAPGGRSIRLGNVSLRAIPASDRLVVVGCSDAGSHRQPRLVAVVTTRMTLEVTSTPRAQAVPGKVLAPCTCQAGEHLIDVAKVLDAVERLRHQPRRARVVDVSNLS